MTPKPLLHTPPDDDPVTRIESSSKNKWSSRLSIARLESGPKTGEHK
jgi:hypothetical protein